MIQTHHSTIQYEVRALEATRSLDESIALLNCWNREHRSAVLQAWAFGGHHHHRRTPPRALARTMALRIRKARTRPPDGLRTRTEAAAKLGCSLKTLDAHVASGALRYVALGHGRKRMWRMFADADLDQFIANQTRKDVPCPSIASRARHTGTSNSESKIIAFTAAPKPRPGAKPKR